MRKKGEIAVEITTVKNKVSIKDDEGDDSKMCLRNCNNTVLKIFFIH